MRENREECPILGLCTDLLSAKGGVNNQNLKVQCSETSFEILRTNSEMILLIQR